MTTSPSEQKHLCKSMYKLCEDLEGDLSRENILPYYTFLKMKSFAEGILLIPIGTCKEYVATFPFGSNIFIT